ncbi:MAG: metallophosphoesterase family protein [Chloroflexota bacterium]
MKIAILADIHGNIDALEAVLEDIDQHHVDMTICAGDVINPFPGSQAAWDMLQERNIPTVLGNHEEYVHTWHNSYIDNEIRSSIQFMPTQFAAKNLRPDTIKAIDSLPKQLTISGPQGRDILICHASPLDTTTTFCRGVSPAMATSLSERPEKIVVAGHFHIRWQQAWRDKWLMLCSSVGLPLEKLPSAQYLLLTYQNSSWHAEYQTVDYDIPATMQRIAKSGYLEEAGPIGWLFFDEIQTADFAVMPFLTEFCPPEKPTTLEGWQQLVQAYFESIGRWEAIARYL